MPTPEVSPCMNATDQTCSANLASGVGLQSLLLPKPLFSSSESLWLLFFLELALMSMSPLQNTVFEACGALGCVHSYEWPMPHCTKGKWAFVSVPFSAATELLNPPFQEHLGAGADWPFPSTIHPSEQTLCLQNPKSSADRTNQEKGARSVVVRRGVGGWSSACPVFLFWFS